METKPASNRMLSLIVLNDMHTKLFNNALEGISDQDTHNRLNTKANHIAWLAGSIIHERFEIANALGVDKKGATGDLFKDNKGIQDNTTYPSLAEYKKDWELISPLLKEAYLKVTDEKLDEKFEMMPGMQMSYYDLISFMTYREASIIGQIALWRRLLGYEAMKYM
jgi:hypothetical protein